MKIVLRIVGPLFIAVGLFWFARGTGLLPWPHNLAMVDYGAGVAALGIGLSRCSCSPWLTPVGFFLVFAAGAEALMVWVSFHHRTSPRDF